MPQVRPTARQQASFTVRGSGVLAIHQPRSAPELTTEADADAEAD